MLKKLDLSVLGSWGNRMVRNLMKAGYEVSFIPEQSQR